MSHDGDTSQYRCVITRRADNTFVARFPDLPGCVAEGETKEAAIKNAENALADWFEIARRKDLKAPPPGASEHVTGICRIRASKSMHAALLYLSQETGIGFSKLVRVLLQQSVERLTSDLGHGTLNQFLGREVEIDALDGMHTATGDWTQRISRETHVALQWLADHEGVSVNLLTNSLLAGSLRQTDGLGSETVVSFPKPNK